MKKVSTAAAPERRKVEGQRLTIGLDLGDRSSWYCVLDGAGEVLLEKRWARLRKPVSPVSKRVSVPRETSECIVQRHG
jgi:hypothetical protein